MHVRNAQQIMTSAGGERKNLKAAHCGLSTSPHNVKERMQSGFLHPVRFPRSQCRVKVCLVCVCVCVRYRFTDSVFTFTKLCGVSIVPEKCNSTESRVMVIPQIQPQRKHPE